MEAPVIITKPPTAFMFQFLPADPSRMILILSGDGTATINVTPVVDPLSNAGIALSAQSPVIELSWAIHGPLVGAQWFASTPGGAILTAISVSLRRHPDMYGYRGVFIERTAQAAERQVSSGTRGARRLAARSLPPGLLRRLQLQAPRIFGGPEG